MSTGALVAMRSARGLNSPKLVTYARLPSGETATVYGNWPVATRLTRCLVAVSITESELPVKPATYAYLPSGDRVRPQGKSVASRATVPVLEKRPPLDEKMPTDPRSPSLTYRREPSGDSARP